MTRTELIAVLASRFPHLTAQDAAVSVKEMLDAIAHSLAHGGRVEIRDFGSFSVNYRPPRTGRNPKTGAAVPVPGKYVPHFKPGKELRKRVDQSMR
jgi:integration host factor subunit beta